MSPLHRPFLLVLCIFCCCCTDAQQSAPFKLVCYYTNWAIYRPSLAKYTPENINPYLCTHLIYAFGGLSGKFEVKPFDAYNDIQQGNIKKFVDLKKHNPKLKTMVAIGGWNEGSKKFSAMVSERENRAKFVRSAMKFLREHKFDGLDLDWEYPTFRDGSHPEDREGYARLVEELREAFEEEPLGSRKEKLLLTMAVPAGQQYIDQGYDMTSLARDLDFINLLTYDYFTAEEPTVQHHAPLFQVGDFEDWEAKKNYNVDFTVQYYIELGVPSEKIVLGIPAYGRAFTLDDEEDHGLGAGAKGAAEAGVSTREAGYLSYYEICKNVQEKDWVVERPESDAVGPYAYHGNQWVGYDDVEMVIEKTKYAVENQLGGVMFWSLDNDDFRGSCGGENSPLVSAARKVLVTSKSKKGTTKKVTTKRPTTTTTTTTTPTTTTRRPRTTTTEASQDIDEEYEDDGLEPSATSNERADRQATSCDFGTKGRRRGRGRQCKEEEAPAEEEEEEYYDEDPLTTPEPPTTPDPGPQFACTDEGFFLNPKDCRKYFWCLDSGPADLGIVPHHFTCPSGLFFNERSDSCDYKENVSCKMKPEAPAPPKRPRSTTAKPKARRRTTTTTEAPEEETIPPEEEVEATTASPSIAQLLHLIEKLGGVEEVQKHLGGDASEAPPEEEPAPPTTTKRSSAARRRTTTTTVATTRKATAPRRTTDASTASPSRRRPALRRKATTTTSTTEEAVVEDAIVDNSRQSSTVRKFQDVGEAAGDAKDGGQETHTFGATRIPGLFNYVVLHRTTTEEQPAAAQLKSILDAMEVKATAAARKGEEEKEDIAADQSTVADITAAKEASPPFEDIGVHIEEPLEDAGSDLLEQAQEATEKAPLPEKDDFYTEEDGAITETLTAQELQETTTTTTTTPSTTTTAAATRATTAALRRRKIIKRVRLTKAAPPQTTPQPTTTTALTITRRLATAAPLPARVAITTTRAPPPPARVTITTTRAPPPPAAVATARAPPPARSFRTTTTTTRKPLPNPEDPLAVRATLNRRRPPSSEDDFQGLVVDEAGELECSEQGVYPHPVECDKFVSCVTIQGHIRAWTYVCPLGQMYDDFTGRCLDEELVECFAAQ